MRLRATSTASTASAASAVFALLKQASVLATFVKIFQKIVFSLQKSFFSCYTLSVVGSVAQLVEQRIENPRVGGSIPPRATRFQAQPLSVGLFRFCFAPVGKSQPRLCICKPSLQTLFLNSLSQSAFISNALHEGWVFVIEP